jgi:hypothetical protein
MIKSTNYVISAGNHLKRLFITINPSARKDLSCGANHAHKREMNPSNLQIAVYAKKVSKARLTGSS